MTWFRPIAVFFDVIALFLTYSLKLGDARGALSNSNLQISILLGLAGLCSLLFFVPLFQKKKYALALSSLKIFLLCLAFLVLPRFSLAFLPVLVSHSAVLASVLPVRIFWTVEALLPAILMIFAFILPHLAWIEASNLYQISLSFVVLAGAALTFRLLLKYKDLWVAERNRVAKLESDLHRLTDANVGFQEYSSLIEQHTLRFERERISREIHDSTGYALTTIKMIFEATKGVLQRSPEKVCELMDQGISLAKDALTEIRSALRELRLRQDPVVEGLPFVVRLVQNFENVTNVRVQYDFTNARQCYDSQINALLYKMVQECLTNAFRHGRASQVELLLFESEGHLKVRILDNGQPQDKIVKGIGMQGMEERLFGVGGSIQFLPHSHGFEIAASIPLSAGVTDAL